MNSAMKKTIDNGEGEDMEVTINEGARLVVGNLFKYTLILIVCTYGHALTDENGVTND